MIVKKQAFELFDKFFEARSAHEKAGYLDELMNLLKCMLYSLKPKNVRKDDDIESVMQYLPSVLLRDLLK